MESAAGRFRTAQERFLCSAVSLSLDALSPMDYINLMAEVRQTAEFSGWLHRLKDANAVARIVSRIRRMEMGNPGDTRGVGHGIFEMRVDYGPGLPDLLCASQYRL
jgi:hypothetical protein